MQSSPREILSPVLCVCVFVPVCVFVLVCETVPVGKKLISRSVSPWFLEATEGNTIIYAAGDGKEETICIPESSQPSLSNLKHLFLLVIDIKRLISDGFVLDCVEERSSIWRLHSFSRAFLPTYLLVVSPVPTGSSVGLTKCLAHKRCFCISLDVPHLYLFNLWGDHGLSKSFPSSRLSKSTSSRERSRDDQGHLRVKEPGYDCPCLSPWCLTHEGVVGAHGTHTPQAPQPHLVYHW